MDSQNLGQVLPCSDTVEVICGIAVVERSVADVRAVFVLAAVNVIDEGVVV